MFPADPYFQVAATFLALPGGNFHQAPDSGPIQDLERIVFQDPQFLVGPQKSPGVIPAVSKCHLGQVICAKGKEIGLGGNFRRHQAGPRDFHHGADDQRQLHPTIRR